MTITAYIFIGLLVAILVTFVMILIKGNGSRKWLNDQFVWFKGFFEETAGQPDKPSHKNLIVLAFAWVFLVAFMKIVVATSVTATAVIPDIPGSWLAFFLGALGIRAAQSAYEAKARAGANTKVSATNSQTDSPPSNTGADNEKGSN